MKKEFIFIEFEEVFKNKKFIIEERLLITKKGHEIDFIIKDKKSKAYLQDKFKTLMMAKLFIKGRLK